MEAFITFILFASCVGIAMLFFGDEDGSGKRWFGQVFIGCASVVVVLVLLLLFLGL